jgi:predicted O-methyltransferase YrrM
MSFEDVMPVVMQWTTATEALAALGAQLSVLQSGSASPEVASALHAVSAAAGLSDLDDIPAPQQATLLAIIRLQLHQALDLLEHADREPGWTFTDPAILDGFGRGSAMVPSLIASAHPDLREVTSFLDVGTGVGLLAVAAANVWPATTVVGIDPWDASLERARANVAHAGLEERITLRRQELASLDESDAYDCVWIPTFFLTEATLEAALPAVVRALQPGGWIALGRSRTAPHPLAQATAALRWVRAGGTDLDSKRAVELLEGAGCASVHVAETPGPGPIELVLGQRPTA